MSSHGSRARVENLAILEDALRGPLMAGGDLHDVAAAVLLELSRRGRALTFQLPPVDADPDEHRHVYISTACLHALTDGKAEHDTCRVVCKYGGELCACPVCKHGADDDPAVDEVMRHVAAILYDADGARPDRGCPLCVEASRRRLWQVHGLDDQLGPDAVPVARVGGRSAAPVLPGERAAYARWREAGDVEDAAALDEFDARRRSAAPTREQIDAKAIRWANQFARKASDAGTHFTEEGVLTLAESFADAVVALLSRSAAEPPEDHGVRLVHLDCDECRQVGRALVPAPRDDCTCWYSGPELCRVHGVAAEPKEHGDGR